MNRTLIEPELCNFPREFHSLLAGAAVYDSSCSAGAQVFYIEKDEGLFLKAAPKGTLEEEAVLTRFFHSKGLSAQVLGYESLERDWLLTRRLSGEDCLNEQYLADPNRLCDTLARQLRLLHETDSGGCPVANRTALRIATAHRNYEANNYDSSLFPDNWGFSTAREAIQIIEENAPHLKADCLIHGDYCLPNILLNDWAFSGFIDVAAGGVGDRHIDLFWGIWSLGFNLKTDRYRDRFLDAYGRADVHEELLRTVAALEVFSG